MTDEVVDERRVASLAGASGLVGGHLLRLLLDDDGWDRVISIGRREGTAPPGPRTWRGPWSRQAGRHAPGSRSVDAGEIARLAR